MIFLFSYHLSTQRELKRSEGIHKPRFGVAYAQLFFNTKRISHVVNAFASSILWDIF